VELRVCYEAGPTGFVLARRLAQLKIPCTVVAPSLLPPRPGERLKTDRRDALKLARLPRAGELTGVQVPAASEAALRDLCRARTEAVQDLRRGRAQRKAFLLRNADGYTGRSAWREAHRGSLRELGLPHPAPRVVLADAIAAIGSAEERLARLEAQMAALLPSWPRPPGSPTLPASLVPSASSVVAGLMGRRGFAPVGARVLRSELGGAWRCRPPRQLRADLGLVPSENRRDQKRRQGGLTKPGNRHARWLRSEAAHPYRLSPKVSQELRLRQQGLSPDSKACAWKAQTRLHQRRMQLPARGKPRHKVPVAVARELTGFVWQLCQRRAPRLTQNPSAAVPDESRFGGN